MIVMKPSQKSMSLSIRDRLVKDLKATIRIKEASISRVHAIMAVIKWEATSLTREPWMVKVWVAMRDEVEAIALDTKILGISKTSIATICSINPAWAPSSKINLTQEIHTAWVMEILMPNAPLIRIDRPQPIQHSKEMQVSKTKQTTKEALPSQVEAQGRRVPATMALVINHKIKPTMPMQP